MTILLSEISYMGQATGRDNRTRLGNDEVATLGNKKKEKDPSKYILNQKTDLGVE